MDKEIINKNLQININVNSSELDKLASDIQRISKAGAMEKWLKDNTKAMDRFGGEIQSMIEKLRSSDDMTVPELRNIVSTFDDIKTSAKETGNVGLKLSDSIKKVFSSFSSLLPSTSILTNATNIFKKMTSEISDLDAAQVSLARASNLSESGLANATKEAYKLGAATAKTGTEVLGTVTQFSQAGYNIEESMNMAEAAIVMTNISEDISETSEAAGSLISILKGFKMSDSDIISIVDKLYAVSNQSPVELGQLAKGLEQISGTMSSAGNSIDETLGLLAGGYSELGDLDELAGGILLIQQRLQGFDQDGNAINGLSATLKESFDNIGISVENADGSLRSMYEIATDYGKILPNLTSQQKQYYGELAAGSDQISVWNAITEQISNVENATTQAMRSSGSAYAENERSLDSIDGKVLAFRNSFEQLSYTIVNSDLVKFFIDLGTTGINALEGIIDFLPSLATLGATIGGIFGAKTKLDYRRRYNASL